MPASKGSTPHSSADGIGETDIARFDAHEIRPEEYDELPEITDDVVARGMSGDGGEIVKRGRGRPKVENPKQQVTMRLDADVIEAMRASGPGWQARANDVLREWIKA